MTRRLDFLLDFSYQGLMYNATPNPGSTLSVAADSPGFVPVWASACRLHNEEYFG